MLESDREYLNCSCSHSQVEWQSRAVIPLLKMHCAIRDDVSAFNCFGNGNKLLHEEITVILIAEWLRFLDSLILLVKYGKFDVALSLVRTLLELTLQLGYLHIDNRDIKAAYYLNSLYLKAYSYNKKQFNGKIDEQSQEMLEKNERILEIVSKSSNKAVSDLYEKLYINGVIDKDLLRSDWYSLYSIKEKGNRLSISELINEVADVYDDQRILLKKFVLYDFLSKRSHGLAAALNLVIVNNVQKFRDYECTEYAGNVLSTTNLITQLVYCCLNHGYPSFKWQGIEKLQEIQNDVNAVNSEWYTKFMQE